MKPKIPVRPLLALLGVATAVSAAAPLRITPRAAGPVRLNMTLGQVKSLPGLKIARTRDGEGLALVKVTHGREEWMRLYADEPDPDKPLNLRAKVNNIEVFSSRFSTADGVRPGMKIADVERRWGRLKLIRRSEIEGREFAEFARAPKRMTFRVTAPNGFAGVYGKGETTRKTAPGAKLASIYLASGM